MQKFSFSGAVRASARRGAAVTIAAALLAASSLVAQEKRPFEPVVGQPGKDVIWVPSPPEMVELMLDLAKVTKDDFVIDLGSGDGRNVIAAARRGARGLGVEYNPDMVELSRYLAREAGVANRATFERGDMFEADISKATVLALFLLPSNMYRLRDTFLSLEPGTRIVANTYGIQDWDPDETRTLENCELWCTALLWIVPARVDGNWRVGEADLVIEQEFQRITGALGGRPLAEGRLQGAEISFSVGDATYTGRVKGSVMEGTMTAGGKQTRWQARRQQ